MAISSKPNIILIISDALRPRDMSLYGRKERYDSRLAKMAEEMLVFENNFSASNGSDPSVTSLFSGKYPATSGFIHQHPFMRQEEIEKLKKNVFWLPLYLQKNGYSTFSATPLHMWFKKGFDFFTDKESLKSGRFLDKPFVKRILLALPNWAYVLGKKVVKVRASPQFYGSPQVINLAIKKINEAKDPFFLFMHLVDTHYPYPIAKIRRVKGKNTLQKIISNIPSQKQKEYVKKRFHDLDAENMTQIEIKRDESISAVSEQIERLWLHLKEKNMMDNTIVFILSDHGDSFGEHGSYFCRGGLYEQNVHVPLMAYLPRMKSGRIKCLTQTTDIPATILDILGDKKQKIDGKSLMPALKQNKEVRKFAILSDAFCDERRAIRSINGKVIIAKRGACFLCGAEHSIKEKESYDLNLDRDEKENIYPKNSDMEKFLK